MTGAVLLVLLAVEGFTILRVGRLLTLHFFLGMLLLGPVALKAGSVIYRFARYYTGSAPYRRKGPPAPLLRLLGPVIILLTAGVFGSGVMLAVAGPGQGPWLLLHRASFILWFCAMTIHVLAYVPRLPRLLAAEARGVAAPGGRRRRARGRRAARPPGDGSPRRTRHPAGPADRLAARRPGDRPAHRAPRGPLAPDRHPFPYPPPDRPRHQYFSGARAAIVRPVIASPSSVAGRTAACGPEAAAEEQGAG